MSHDPHDSPGQFTAPGEVRFVRLLPGPIERVWEYLTDSEKRSRWLAAGPMELRVGGSVRHEFKHGTLTPHAEAVPDKFKPMMTEAGERCDFTGQVTRCDPPRLLAYTWGSPPSEVTFELATEGAQVRLVLTHRRLGDDKDALVGVGSGWHTHLAVLAAKLAGETPPPFWATFLRHEAAYTAAVAQRAAGPGVALRIVVKSILVDDQEKALQFYTGKLGFLKKTEVPLGEYRWLTVVSPYTPDGVELLLEPNVNPAARTFQSELKAQGIPLTMFGVDDLAATCARLAAAGVTIVQPPVAMGPVQIATIDDTCGNLLQLVQQ